MCTTLELLSGLWSKWCLCYSNICQFQIILRAHGVSLLSVDGHWGIFQLLSLLPSFPQKHPSLFKKLSWTVLSLCAPLPYPITQSSHFIVWVLTAFGTSFIHNFFYFSGIFVFADAVSITYVKYCQTNLKYFLHAFPGTTWHIEAWEVSPW